MSELCEKNRKQFAAFYLLCFLVNFSWLWWNELLFSSLKPVFFLNRLDFTHNVLMLTNLQHFLIDKRWLQIVFDVLYALLPLLLWWATRINHSAKTFIAYCTIFFTLVYTSFLSSVTYISNEVFIGFVFIPLVLSARTLKGFYFYLHVIRIIFILIFISAALAKIRTGAIFNEDQMAGILLWQHNTYLVSSPQAWFARGIYFLVQHKALTQCFYILAIFAEMIFVVGLLTKKYDRYMIIVFCLFVAFDYFLMGINYCSWLVFMGCFYFSASSLKDKMPTQSTVTCNVINLAD